MFAQTARFVGNGENYIKWSVQFDPEELRIPGKSFRIGISEIKGNGEIEETRGLLKGKVSWKKYRVVVEGATFRRGEISIPETNSSLIDQSLVLKVYRVKSPDLLFTVKIPYHYETDMKILTIGNMGKVPGSIVKYAFRIYFNNESYQDFYPPKAKRRLNIFRIDSSEIVKKTKLDSPLDKFTISADGGYFLKRYLVIENDPFNIKHHRARFMGSLAKNPKIADTIETELDYKNNYSFDSRYVRNYCISPNSENEDHDNNLITYSSGYYGENGHNLKIYADIYKDSFFKDSLLLVSVTDLTNCGHYHYLVNTKGGSIKIYSHGLDGSDGSNGQDGSDGAGGGDGSHGSDGKTITKIIYNNDGTTSTVTETGPGGDGDDGSNGASGGNGTSGTNGSNGGDGGNIYFDYTKEAIAFLYLLDIQSIPGSGGRGGKGGKGGKGGEGGKGGQGGGGNPRGTNGTDGVKGNNGSNGTNGLNGSNGKEGIIIRQLIK
jgi:hypothetical protein